VPEGRLQLFITIAPWFVTLFSVWLTWYLSARSKRIEADRAALGRALAGLLLVRHELSRAKKGKELLEALTASKLPAEVDVTFKFLLQFLFPDPRSLQMNSTQRCLTWPESIRYSQSACASIQ
jgi:hypothetical protein